jgi:purine-binding chemotaxis protein CheW
VTFAALVRMDDSLQLVVMRLERQRYALPLAIVERVIRAVAVTPLPHAPAIVHGAINVGGRVVPVLNLRRRLGLPEREITPADTFVLAATSRRTVALVIDEAEEIVTQPRGQTVEPADISPGLTQLAGVVKLDGDLVLIYDLELFLSHNEASALDNALAGLPAEW